MWCAKCNVRGSLLADCLQASMWLVGAPTCGEECPSGVRDERVLGAWDGRALALPQSSCGTAAPHALWCPTVEYFLSAMCASPRLCLVFDGRLGAQL